MHYQLSPFVTFIESHLHPDPSRYAVFHRLTGQVIELAPAVRSLLQAIEADDSPSLTGDDSHRLAERGLPIQSLIDSEFLISHDHDPLSSFADYYVTRPLQNPAVAYRNEAGEMWLVSISMAEKIYSPPLRTLPPIIEEVIPPLAMNLFLAADGSVTLGELHRRLRGDSRTVLDDEEFRRTVAFLTAANRQLIKLAPNVEVLGDPFQPANIVPRNFYHAEKSTDHKSIGEFHGEGIADALWEFDIIEPTVNHALRFTSELLGGLDYGSRFCQAVLSDIGSLRSDKLIDVLEIGGGTGSFARSFIERARSLGQPINYHILDLSPALAENQRRVLNILDITIDYIAQDATQFTVPGRKFDLILANEVIADFPVATVERRFDGSRLGNFGDGVVYVEKYELPVDDAPASFSVNAGVFDFLERAWLHLNPGGTLVMSEYGSESVYPTECFHLNHAEFSIHFGHVKQCARKIGFGCRTITLSDFLGINDQISVLNGREEHILCLNHVLEQRGANIPFALFSEHDFEVSFGKLASQLSIESIRFLPLHRKFYYGPNIDDFLVLILTKAAA